MKRGIIICLISLLFVNILFVNASSTFNLKTPINNYDISLISVNPSSVAITINGVNIPSLGVQTSPYTLNYPVDGLYPVLRTAEPSRYAGDKPSQVTLLLFLEQNLTETNNINNPVQIQIGDKSYNISALIGSGSAVITINGGNSPSLNVQNSPYTPNYPVDGLYPIVKSLYQSRYAGDTPSQVTLLLAYEINLTEECSENWTCSDWSTCMINQQTRTCTDSNNCGTIANKPSETQSCTPPTPQSSCTGNVCTLYNGQELIILNNSVKVSLFSSNRITLSVGSSSQSLYSGSSYNFNGIIITPQKIDYQGYPGGMSSIVFTYNASVVGAVSENNNASLTGNNVSTTITKSTVSNTQESLWQRIINWFKRLFGIS